MENLKPSQLLALMLLDELLTEAEMELGIYDGGVSDVKTSIG